MYHSYGYTNTASCWENRYIIANTMYFSTTQGYTYVSNKATIMNTISNSYTYSAKITNSNTFTNTNSLTYYTTYIQYSTMTIKMMPSPSPKTILNDKVELNADLLLITINSWILK
jgi:hypothetical protein